MFKKYKQSILFHSPDYHCSFFYQNELKKLGWQVDILVPRNYPEKILYSNAQILTVPYYTGKYSIDYLIWFIKNIYKYRFIIYYGRPPDFSYILKKLHIDSNLEPLLSVLKILGKKIVYIPAGCRDEFTKLQFSLFENGNICGNCGFFSHCDEASNIRNLYLVNKYADLVIGTGFTKPAINNWKPIKWKSFDLTLFNSNIEIPENFLLPNTNNLRILHATSLENRDSMGKNIKGSLHIEKAVEKLKNEGFKCELIRITNIDSKNMRYLQVQADLIIDQLIYGHWGSSSLEGIALGKPVICYFNKTWKQNYINALGIEIWPFIEADTNNIYDVLKNLINDSNLRTTYSKLSENFALEYLDVTKNAREFIDILNSI
jgi:glycosyltransferase involved in cell wall biosynthesis